MWYSQATYEQALACIAHILYNSTTNRVEPFRVVDVPKTSHDCTHHVTRGQCEPKVPDMVEEQRPKSENKADLVEL